MHMIKLKSKNILSFYVFFIALRLRKERERRREREREREREKHELNIRNYTYGRHVLRRFPSRAIISQTNLCA